MYTIYDCVYTINDLSYIRKETVPICEGGFGGSLRSLGPKQRYQRIFFVRKHTHSLTKSPGNRS